ncbi:MAG TPA: hypothetical protein VH092_08165 [Urbifossiella sp.]|jgi:hypothetical protein|nr:hypothetical protein [Urbifossiella sp.]
MPLPDLRIQQAVLVADVRGVRVAAQSDGFDAPEAERLAVLYGRPPAGVACPLAHFARPFGARHVAVVQVADRPGGGLGLRFLVLAADLYRHLGDPFAVADRYPPDWSAAGPLPALEWPPEPLPPRTTAGLRAVLTGCDPATEEMALLLGSTQVLVDGGQVLLERRVPDERLLRSLWALLPDKARAELWPASFAFGPDLAFDAAAMPEPPPDGARHTEDGLKGYPPGNYEHRLQAAVEAGDERELAALLARRTGADTIRLGLTIIAGAVLLAAALKFIL